MFYLLLLLCSVVAAVLLLLPLLRYQQQTTNEIRQAVNVETAATRLAELKQELTNGEITKKEFETFRLDIENAAADDLRQANTENGKIRSSRSNVLLGGFLLVCIPALSLWLYQQLGNEQALLSEEELFTQALAIAEQKVFSNPDDVEGRIALAQVYADMQRFEDAADLYAELNQLQPDNPDILTLYADVLARSVDNRLAGEPYALLKQALTIDPHHERALWLVGFAEIQAEQPQQAVIYWQRLQAGLEPDSEIYQQITKLINEVSPESVVADDNSITEQVSKVAIEVAVRISDEMTTKINPDATLFIFARAAEGPPMPLAVYKGLAQEIPTTVVLDSSMGMVPGMNLSKFNTVIIGARISSNGQPQGQSGDPEGFSTMIDLKQTQSVSIEINSTQK